MTSDQELIKQLRQRNDKLLEALEHIARHQKIIAGSSLGKLSATGSVANRAIEAEKALRAEEVTKCG